MKFKDFKKRKNNFIGFADFIIYMWKQLLQSDTLQGSSRIV